MMEEQGQKASSLNRHRSGASMDTNASGISFNTLVTKQLPKFPQPPSEIPPSPLGTEFGTPLTTPTRSHFNATPPMTPRRKGFQNDFRLPTSSHGSSSSPNTIRQGSRDTDTASNPSQMVLVTPSPHDPKGDSSYPSTSLIGGPEAKSSPKTNNLSPLASRSPQNTVSVLPTHNTNSPLPHLSSKPLSRRPPALNLVPKEMSSHPLRAPSPPVASPQPHDWHEGSSGIVVDANEDRMLSTSFITGLLASTQRTFEESSLPYSGQQKHSSSCSFSETTYPSLPPYHPTNQLTPALPPVSTAPPQHLRSDLVPLASPPLFNFARSSSSSAQHTPPDSEVAHFDPEDEQPSIIRAVSMSKSGVRGASVVGYASATLHNLQGASSSQLSLNNSNQAASSLLAEQTKPQEPNTSYYHCVRQQMTVSVYGNDPAPVTNIPALPANAELRTQPRDGGGGDRIQRSARQSIHSTRSTRSYVSSLISRISHAPVAVFNRFRPKPLPPLPVQASISIIAESGHQKLGSIVALPALVDCAGTFSEMSERGHHPQDSLLQSRQYKDGYTENTGVTTHTLESWHYSHGKPSRRVTNRSRWNSTPDIPEMNSSRVPRKKRRVLFLIAILVVVVVVAVILGVLLGTRRGHSDRECPENFTGAACTLDATCVCTSSVAGRCDQLAQSLVTLTPTLNTLFRTNFTTNLISTGIWEAQGAPLGGNCASQANLVDVAPALDFSKAPNRTIWTQSALLWNLVNSQDVGAIKKMQSFVRNAPWNELGNMDGPVSQSSSFTLSISGFVFDFAAQTVSQPSVSFVSNGSPTSEQAAKVGSTARPALDRMYSFALASSSQQQQAMATYWRTVLQQKPEDLTVFMSAVMTSPILIPFDTVASPANSPISSLLTNSSSTPFPPPVACYPGLNTAQIQTVNSIETSVFGLPSISSASKFDTSCYADRPVYGVLDLLRLRLPFVDSQLGAPKQAAVLKRDVATRGVIYNNGLLSELPGNTAPQNLTTDQTDARQYGTLNHLNHVILKFLSSISDVNIATALVQYLLSSPSVPPADSSVLFKSIESIPALELAIFGSITPSDILSTVSSFSTPSGSLFFGSDQADALRQWAINAAGASVVWSESATSAQVVRDSSFADSTFHQVWDPARAFFLSPQPGITVSVSNITDAFRATGKFSP